MSGGELEPDTAPPVWPSRRLLILTAVGSVLAVVVGLVLEFMALLTIEWRGVNHGSGDYLGAQVFAILIGVGVPVVSAVMLLIAWRRRVWRTAVWWCSGITVVCLAAAGALIVTPSIGVFAQAPGDDRSYRQQLKEDEFDAAGDDGIFTVQDAVDAAQPEVEATLDAAGVSVDSVTPKVHRADGTAPHGNACRIVTATYQLPSSVDKDDAEKQIARLFQRNDDRKHGYFSRDDATRELSLTLYDADAELDYRPGDRVLVMQTDCVIDAEANRGRYEDE